MTSQELIQKMYAAIHNAVAPAAPGDAPPTSIFTMMSQGLAINPEDYDPDESPANRNRLADMIPFVQKNFAAKTMKVSDVYKQILTSQFPPDKEPTPQECEELQEAEKYLNTQEVADAYLECMEAYTDAQNAYWSAVNAKDPQASRLKSKLDAALTRWKTVGHKDKYEAALAVQDLQQKARPPGGGSRQGLSGGPGPRLRL